MHKCEKVSLLFSYFRSAVHILVFLTWQIILAKDYLLGKYEKQLNKNKLLLEFKYIYFFNVGSSKHDCYAAP